jgi:hypothetical protein
MRKIIPNKKKLSAPQTLGKKSARKRANPRLYVSQRVAWMIIFFPNACGIISFFSVLLLKPHSKGNELLRTLLEEKSGAFSGCVTEYA